MESFLIADDTESISRKTQNMQISRISVEIQHARTTNIQMFRGVNAKRW